MADCVFCKIVQNELPAAKVFENEHVVAFMDISQTTKGHTLIIPKKHAENIYELDEETASELFKAVPKIARAIKESLRPLGLNIVNNNEKEAGQAVFHYHLHLVPRYGKEDGFYINWQNHSSDYSFNDLEKMSEQIKQAFS